MMRTCVLFDAFRYTGAFMLAHSKELIKVLLLFMATAFFIGLIGIGSPDVLLTSLQDPLLLVTIKTIHSPLFFIFMLISYAVWNVSFVTYLLALERQGTASLVEHLKKSLSWRVAKIMLFDVVVILFLSTLVFLFAISALGIGLTQGLNIGLLTKIILGLLFVILAISFMILIIRLWFTKIVIADTNTDIFTALSASWTATQGSFWRLFLMGIVTGVIGFFIAALGNWTLIVFPKILGTHFLVTLTGIVIQLIMGMITIVFMPIFIMYYYLHLRVVRSLVAGR